MIKKNLFLIFIVFMVFYFIGCGSKDIAQKDLGVSVAMDDVVKKSIAYSSGSSNSYFLTFVCYEVTDTSISSPLLNKVKNLKGYVKFEKQLMDFSKNSADVTFNELDINKKYKIEVVISSSAPELYDTVCYYVANPIAFGSAVVNNLSTSGSNITIQLSEFGILYRNKRTVSGNISFDLSQLPSEQQSLIQSKLESNNLKIVALCKDGSISSKIITSSDSAFSFDLICNKEYGMFIWSSDSKIIIPIKFDRYKDGSLPYDYKVSTIFNLTKDSAAINLGTLLYKPIISTVSDSEFTFTNDIFNYIDRDADGIVDYNDSNPYNFHQGTINEKIFTYHPAPAKSKAKVRKKDPYYNYEYYAFDEIPNNNLLNRMKNYLTHYSITAVDDVDGDSVPDWADADVDNDGVRNLFDDDIDGNGQPETVSDLLELGKKAFYHNAIDNSIVYFTKAYINSDIQKSSTNFVMKFVNKLFGTSKTEMQGTQLDELNFYLSMTRLYYYLDKNQEGPDDNRIDSIKELLDAFGMGVNMRKISDFNPDAPKDANMNTVLKAGTTQTEIQRYLTLDFMREIDFALMYLDRLTNSFNLRVSEDDINTFQKFADPTGYNPDEPFDFDKNFNIVPEKYKGDGLPSPTVEVDYGDILIYKTFLTALKANIFYGISSGNLSIRDSENRTNAIDIINIVKLSDYDVQGKLLNANPNFLKPTPDRVNELGTRYIELARKTYIEAFQLYKSASDFIRAEGQDDPKQTDDLISFVTAMDTWTICVSKYMTYQFDEDDSIVSYTVDDYCTRYVVCSNIAKLENDEAIVRSYCDTTITSLQGNKIVFGDAKYCKDTINVNAKAIFDLTNGLRDLVPAFSGKNIAAQNRYDYSKFKTIVPDWSTEKIRLELSEKDLIDTLVYANVHSRSSILYNSSLNHFYASIGTDTTIIYGVKQENGNWTFETVADNIQGYLINFGIIEANNITYGFATISGETEYALKLYSKISGRWSSITVPTPAGTYYGEYFIDVDKDRNVFVTLNNDTQIYYLYIPVSVSVSELSSKRFLIANNENSFNSEILRSASLYKNNSGKLYMSIITDSGLWYGNIQNDTWVFSKKASFIYMYCQGSYGYVRNDAHNNFYGVYVIKDSSNSPNGKVYFITETDSELICDSAAQVALTIDNNGTPRGIMKQQIGEYYNGCYDFYAVTKVNGKWVKELIKANVFGYESGENSNFEKNCGITSDGELGWTMIGDNLYYKYQGNWNSKWINIYGGGYEAGKYVYFDNNKMPQGYLVKSIYTGYNPQNNLYQIMLEY